MKSERRSFPRSAQASQRRTPGSGDRTLVESKCLACGRMADTMMHQSLERGEDAGALPYPGAEKRVPDSIDLQNLLHFSQQLYAHALTLQEVIRSQGEATYEVLRSRYDRQAAQQFELFYHTFKQPSAFRQRAAGSCE